MIKEELEALRNRAKASGQTLKSVLKEEGIAYSTYNYWRKKLDAEKREDPIVSITVSETQASNAGNTLAGVRLPGVTLAWHEAYP